MTKTKKIGSAGRFGARYGRRVKAIAASLEKFQRVKQKCPYCKKFAVRRISLGIYKCRKCDSKFAGKAYFLD